jgi:hypothetical protein
MPSMNFSIICSFCSEINELNTDFVKSRFKVNCYCIFLRSKYYSELLVIPSVIHHRQNPLESTPNIMFPNDLNLYWN